MTSAKFSPAARTAMRTSPRSGCGAALSRTARTSGPPALVIQTARIDAPSLRRSLSIVPPAAIRADMAEIGVPGRSSVIGLLVRLCGIGETGRVNLDDVPQPENSTARAALEVAAAYCSPALLNHCLRSHIWAASYGISYGIDFDAELLYVSAMLHDIGLVKEFDSHTVPFEEAGGHVAWFFGAAADGPVERRVRAAEVIVRHMWDKVDVNADPEGHLLEIGT